MVLSRSERSGALYNLDRFIICPIFISESKMRNDKDGFSRVVSFFTGGWYRFTFIKSKSLSKVIPVSIL